MHLLTGQPAIQAERTQPCLPDGFDFARPLEATFVSQPLSFVSHVILNNLINALLTFLRFMASKFEKVSDIHVVAPSRSPLNSNVSFQNNFNLILIEINLPPLWHESCNNKNRSVSETGFPVKTNGLSIGTWSFILNFRR
jgi:hypothetical protein